MVLNRRAALVVLAGGVTALSGCSSYNPFSDEEAPDSAEPLRNILAIDPSAEVYDYDWFHSDAHLSQLPNYPYSYSRTITVAEPDEEIPREKMEMEATVTPDRTVTATSLFEKQLEESAEHDTIGDRTHRHYAADDFSNLVFRHTEPVLPPGDHIEYTDLDNPITDHLVFYEVFEHAADHYDWDTTGGRVETVSFNDSESPPSLNAQIEVELSTVLRRHGISPITREYDEAVIPVFDATESVSIPGRNTDGTEYEMYLVREREHTVIDAFDGTAVVADDGVLHSYSYAYDFAESSVQGVDDSLSGTEILTDETTSTWYSGTEIHAEHDSGPDWLNSYFVEPDFEREVRFDVEIQTVEIQNTGADAVYGPLKILGIGPKTSNITADFESTYYYRKPVPETTTEGLDDTDDFVSPLVLNQDETLYIRLPVESAVSEFPAIVGKNELPSDRESLTRQDDRYVGDAEDLIFTEEYLERSDTGFMIVQAGLSSFGSDYVIDREKLSEFYERYQEHLQNLAVHDRVLAIEWDIPRTAFDDVQ